MKSKETINRRILFVDHDVNNSGSTVSMNYLIDAFRDEGYEVFILTPKSISGSVKVEKESVRVLRFHSRFIKSFMLDLAFTDRASVFTLRGWNTIIKDIGKLFVGLIVVLNAVRKIQPDLIYVNEYVVIQASIIGHYLKIPTAIHVRSRFIKGAFGFRRSLIARAVVKYNDLVFAITKQEKDQLAIKAGEENKVKVIGEFLGGRNFTIPEDLAKIREKFGIPNKMKIVLMLGGILKIKGALDFLKSAQIILESQKDVIFIIAGKIFDESIEDKQYCEKCMSILNSPKISPFIRLIGHIENPEALLACADIFISPITDSHFSRPVIEAWALKKAVISYDNAHAEELISNRINGVLVETGNYQELSRTVIELLQNNDFANRLGENGYKKVRDEFNPDLTIKAIVKHCDQLIMRKKNSSLVLK
jgi:glycosyltransferase involved in cell wall biosynthesis